MPHANCTSSDRDQLQLFLGQGESVRTIAQALSKHPSTIYREISRNKTNGVYISGRAQTHSQNRRHECKPCPKRDNPRIMKEVMVRFKNKHSPEQISGRLKLDYPEDSGMHVSVETIYTHIYAQIQKGDTSLGKHFRQGHRKRRKALKEKDMRGIIPGRTMIDFRPLEVDSKETYGHWEGDTVEGAGKSGYLATFTERKNKILLAYPIPNKTAECLNHAAQLLFRKIPARYKKSLTVDNGKEFSRHKELSRKIRMPVFFAHPYHSWERGLNEHTNGLLRQYFPKSMDLLYLNPRKLAKAVLAINNRPRRCLGYRTPNEVFSDQKFAFQI